MNLKITTINKIVALDIESDCADALERVAEALREFGYCGEGTDLCSEIQRAISEYNTRWDSCVKPWAKECGREDTSNDLGEIPFWIGPGTWWGCVRGSMLQEKKSKCSIEVLDEIFAMSRAFIGVKDDIFTINTDICPNCFLDTGGRVMPQVVIPDVLKLGTLPENTESPLKEVMGAAKSINLKEALSKVTRAAEYGPGRTPLNSRYEACLAQADDAAAVCGSNCPGGGHGADDMECLRQCYCNRCDNKYKCRVKTYAPNGGVIPQGWIDEASACRAEYGCQGGA